jgi:putative isomerase
VEYIGTLLDGTTMNADAVDLNSLWSMDAEYLASIATALGKPVDAARFENEHNEMNKRINDRLWNEQLGIYCSRFWKVPPSEGPALDQSVFKEGVDIHFYRDLGLTNEAAQRHDAAIDYNWGEKGPAEGVLATGWSARVTGTFTAPETGTYRFKMGGSQDIRFSFEGREIDHWLYDSGDRRLADLPVEAGKNYPIVLEYFRGDERRATLRLSVHRLEAGKPGSDWLTRLTPMNFYPLIAGAADKVRADKTLAWMYREDKFWLPWLLPTTAKDDPVWPNQRYWHGYVWPPANYLVWLGVERYADAAHRAEYTRRSVKLFMQNWIEHRQSCENYNSTTGACGDQPHDGWGNLFNLMGIEALVEVGPDFKPVPRSNSGITENLTLHHVPFGGKLYRIEARGGKVTATEESQQ